MSDEEQENRLVRMVEDAPWFMRALHEVRSLRLPDWCVGAGAIRNLVWDHFHGFSGVPPLRDVDVTYFDPTDVDRERHRALAGWFSAEWPEMPWEETNQAGVHNG